MLNQIQHKIADLYDLKVSLWVENFVCREDVARHAIGHEVERREAVIVVEEPDELSVGVYIAQDALDTLSSGGATDWFEENSFRAVALATEAVSHFVYLVFRADHKQSLSQLELELQAEVDKYATGLLAGNGVGAFLERSRALRKRLFEDVSYLDDKGSEEGERYRLANDLAASYTAKLESQYVKNGELPQLSTDLRRFYRMGINEKVRRARR